jgi:tRNA threonylcarbamoyladenosine biosynthesis protein TsaE
VLARTTSVDDTRALAGALAALVRPGDVVLLTGEMGAGKTAFVQGLGAALGVDERITSPTFTLAHTYEGGRVRVHHLDVYRLEHLHEALDLGLAEMVDDGAVVVIEWGDAIVPVLPADYLEIRITFAPLDDDPAAGDVRRWQMRPVGARWTARADSLRATLEPWEDAS